MKRLAITALLLALTSAAFCKEPHFKWIKLAEGLEFSCDSFDLNGAPRYVSAVRYNPALFHTEIINDPGLEQNGENSAPTSVLAKRHGALAAINGSYFNMKTLYPTTYVRDDGVYEGFVDSTEFSRVNGLVAVKGNAVEIMYSGCGEYEKNLDGFDEALAAGPVLVHDGKRVTEWNDTSNFVKGHPRSVIGISKDGWIYMIVADGRFPGVAEGTTLDETAEICGMFSLTDALNLDGGGSSCLWTRETGVLSHPSDNKIFDHEGERRVPNAIAVLPL